MKELPYFRFTPQEWQNKDISVQSYQVKGFFIDLCCYYWLKNCELSKSIALKKFINSEQLLKELVEQNIVKIIDENIVINFLDEQFSVLNEIRVKRQTLGRLGGQRSQANAKAKVEQLVEQLVEPTSSYNNKDNNKDKLESEISKPKYSIFYDNEIKISENDPNYIKFVEVLYGSNTMQTELTKVLSMKRQCTYKQFKIIYNLKLEKNINISEFLVKMENWNELTKKNTSVQQTLLNWIKRENGKSR
jgi:hypothetical protein